MTLATKLLVVSILLLTTMVSAQDFQGKAIYKSHTKMDFELGENNNSEMEKQLQEQLRKQLQQTYTLEFSREESIYTRDEELSKPSPQQSGITFKVGGGSDIYYKNLKENRYVKHTEAYGKRFLIKDSIQKRSWELVNETKNIGNYTCYKAIYKSEYKRLSINDEKDDLETVTKERITTAWYTLDIPINNGPGPFSGLPGLILEINDGDQTLLCSKLVMNPNEKFDIKEPNKGKEISQKEFDEIMNKKTKEMMENFKARKNKGSKVMYSFGE